MPETSRGGEVIVIRDQTIESRSYILTQPQKSLESRSYTLAQTQESLESRSYIESGTKQESLESRSDIQQTYSEDLNSRSAVQTSNSETLESISYISTAEQKTLKSRSAVLREEQETLESNSHIASKPQKTLESRSNIFNSKSHTIESQSVISVSCLTGDIADDMWLEFMEDLGIKQAIVYKDYSNEREDPMTGQKIKGTPDEYNIYARVEKQTASSSTVKIGSLGVGDALIYLPARIRYDTDWNPISGAGDIRPHKYDEIEYQGMTYRIKNLTFRKLGKTEIYAECYCTRVKDEAPEGWS